MSRIVQLIVITLSIFATAAFATEFIPSSLPSQVSDSPILVRGTIGNTYSDWGNRDDGSRGLYTFYQLQPTEVLKGQISAGATILFREIGGQKDGMAEGVPGAAEFTHDEDVVVSLSPQNKDGSYDLRGLSAGKYNVTHEEDGTESIASVALAPPPHEGRWTMTDLKKAIKDQGATPSKKNALLASPRVSNSPSPPASISNTPVSAPSQSSAQTSDSELASTQEHDFSALWIAGIIAGLVLIGLLVRVALKKRI